MVATPTFIAPTGDALTDNRFGSGNPFDDRSSESPLWAAVQDFPDDPRHRITRILPQTGAIVQPPRLASATLPIDAVDLRVVGLGGDEHTIWVIDHPVRRRVWKLHPTTFAIEASREAPHPPLQEPFGNIPGSIGGDSKTVWFFQFTPRYGVPAPPWNAHNLYTLYRLDGTHSSLPVSANHSFRYIQTLDGDSDVVWAIHKDINTGSGLNAEYRTAQLLRIGPSLEIEDIVPAPLRGDGHRAFAIAGGIKNIHLLTYHQGRDEQWIHWINPDTYEIRQSYGPFVSRWRFFGLGGS